MLSEKYQTQNGMHHDYKYAKYVCNEKIASVGWDEVMSNLFLSVSKLTNI
jgi:hypothetical protein